MEHNSPTNTDPSPEAFGRRFRSEARRPRLADELMDELPEPGDAPEFFVRMMADEIRRDFVDTVEQGRDLDPVSARMIAYSLVRHAPADAMVAALTAYYKTGEGRHDQLRAEYLPLYQHPRMTPEGRFLLDLLGTHLFRQEHPRAWRNDPPARLSAWVIQVRQAGISCDLAVQHGPGLEAEGYGAMLHEAVQHTRKRGDAFRAYLRLPGVDATAETLLHDFERSYLGLHGDDVDVDIPGFGCWLDGTPCPQFRWDGIEIGGTVHVFLR